MAANQTSNSSHSQMEGSSYNIIRDRLQKQGNELQERLSKLNIERRDVFGATETKIIANDRISTDNNCLARDIVALSDDYFWFGYNVQIGLKVETKINDVFSLYRYDRKEHRFLLTESEALANPQFLQDFQNLYQFYRETSFSKFALIGPHLFMVFQVGKTTADIKTFKWTLQNGRYQYVDNRSDHEFRYPNQHEFNWKRVNRDMHRSGLHPHISISDRLFVETIGGDLTLKIENNTSSGQGIYSEPVEQADQTLDDASIYYSEVGSLIILKILPYQEEAFRYLVYNEKIKDVKRLDALADSCVLLPEDQGLIFAKGYYIQSGEVKLFDNDLQHIQFEKKINSPNGEDVLYIFYQVETGTYILLRYNLIEQEVSTPIICNGYSLFEDGELIYFRSEQEQTKHHLIQIWQTPFYSPNRRNQIDNNSYIAKIGNKDIVRALAEARDLLKLVYKEDSYQGLYNDLTKKSTDLIDNYHWLSAKETFNLEEPLLGIRSTAKNAIDEFEKVQQLKKDGFSKYDSFRIQTEKELKSLKAGLGNHIDEYVKRMSELRQSRGRVVQLLELPYINTAGLNELESKLQSASENLSGLTASFLLKEQALNPYRSKLETLEVNLAKVRKSIEAKALEDESLNLSQELELLIETISNLKIEDTTKSTAIIDRISSLYAEFNQAKASIKNKLKELVKKEGASEFKAQLRLVDQSLSNYLELADEPEKCDTYLNKLMIQLEELESRFSEAEEFIVAISDLRDEVYNNFESRKIQLTEAKNQRALKLSESGKRILQGIQRRLNHMTSLDEIQSYYASDFMVLKLRDQAKTLLNFGESVKADELESSLKSTYEEAIRQLRDKQDLFADGNQVIKLGKHKFNVNTQEVDLSLVQRNDELYFHINGTGFFEKLEDDILEECRPAWHQTVRSENPQVYRAEFLAYTIFKSAIKREKIWDIDKLKTLTAEEIRPLIEAELSDRFDESYIKGVHDIDALLILQELVKLHFNLGALRFSTKSRLWAHYTWEKILSSEEQKELRKEFDAVKGILEFFPDSRSFKNSWQKLYDLLKGQNELQNLLEASEKDLREAADYFFDWLSGHCQKAFKLDARQLTEKFEREAKKSQAWKRFSDAQKVANESHWIAGFNRTSSWLRSFVDQHNLASSEDTILAAIYLLGLSKLDMEQGHLLAGQVEISELRGDHPKLKDGKLNLDYLEIKSRIDHFIEESLPRYDRFQKRKKEVLQAERESLRLETFKPKIMSSFVRNELLDEVYLPLVGSNLAKQIGAAGKNKRTDLMGMLLLVSPPGYGKTTLMEYISARLGLVFMKINGPALGHSVTSIDPETAPNAGAREELLKLNLAFEMGDNVMIYLDDIQHCNPEFLQKFISLCDGQRKIEGVYKGKSKTYDFRGKKVAVIMAGNPYTESGDKFKIPDMLANRADIYNLGDIIGGKAEAFELSYIENALSSNRSLSLLGDKPRTDLKAFLRAAIHNQPENLSLKANYSATEKEELLQVLKLAAQVRSLVLKVNKLYILSAGQAEAYRTEPAFKLQGSYRDMNKLCEKLSPLMNEKELEQIILSHYENESQTLTQGAEFNFLRLKQMFQKADGNELERLSSILASFEQEQKSKGYGGNQVAPIVERLEQMGIGLQDLVRIFENQGKQNES